MTQGKLLLHISELVKIQDTLIKSKIDAVYLKGFLQHFYLTKRWPQKTPVDIDILIPPKSFNRVKNILVSLGYNQYRKYLNPQSRPQVNFVKETSIRPIVCDVHNQIFFPTKYIFNVLPPKLVKQITAEFLDSAKTFSFQNKKFRILEPEDMLLHQCLNFFFHHSCRNQHQIYDIALIINKTKINWKIVISRLDSWNLKEFVYYPLLMANQIAKARIHNSVLKELKPKNLFSSFAPLFINSKTVASPIKNMHIRFRYNIFLRFLIFNQPVLQKIQAAFFLIIFPNRIKQKE